MVDSNVKTLPLFERPDLTPYLIHLTKNTKNDDEFSAFENLKNILVSGEIWGSGNSGSIKGKSKATCFMDVPFASLKYVINERDSKINKPRYEPYGVVVTKKTAYDRGVRPVMYLSDSEVKTLKIPASEIWRVVKFEFAAQRQITWIHEREWRCSGNFEVPKNPFCVLVKTATEAKELMLEILKKPKEYKVKPRSIIPLEVICQGLIY